MHRIVLQVEVSDQRSVSPVWPSSLNIAGDLWMDEGDLNRKGKVGAVLGKLVHCTQLFTYLPLVFTTTQVYESSSKMEQFVTRFLLRETMNQLQSLQVSLECAADTIEEQAGRERYNEWLGCLSAVNKEPKGWGWGEVLIGQCHPVVSRSGSYVSVYMMCCGRNRRTLGGAIQPCHYVSTFGHMKA